MAAGKSAGNPPRMTDKAFKPPTEAAMAMTQRAGMHGESLINNHVPQFAGLADRQNLFLSRRRRLGCGQLPSDRLQPCGINSEHERWGLRDHESACRKRGIERGRTWRYSGGAHLDGCARKRECLQLQFELRRSLADSARRHDHDRHGGSEYRTLSERRYAGESRRICQPARR